MKANGAEHPVNSAFKKLLASNSKMLLHKYYTQLADVIKSDRMFIRLSFLSFFLRS